MAGLPYYSYASLLLNFAGSNNSTTFTDLSPSPKTVTPSGDTKISTAQFRLGSSSGYFDGSGDYLTISTDAAFGFETGDFTIGMLFYPTRANTTETIIDLRESDSAIPLVFGKSSGNQLRTYDGNAVRVAGTVTHDSWNYAEWNRIAGNNYVSLNGSVVQSFYNLFNLGSTRPVCIGSNVIHNAEVFKGYIDTVFVLKGRGIHNSSFAPPTRLIEGHESNLSGNLTESLDITTWRITAIPVDIRESVSTTTATGTTYSIDTYTSGPCNIVVSPKIDYAWSTSMRTTLDDIVVASDPDGTSHLWKCTSDGITHSTTEPIWNLSGTTTDNTTTWTYVSQLVDPKSIGPKMPT